MPQFDELQVWLDARLPELLDAHGVPAASVAVSADGALFGAAAGLLNLETGVAATEDSVFQIGSITKVFTTTLVMQLVDEGLLNLDAPLRTALPEFALADEAAAARITARQLLSHSGGFEGDIFTDTGAGDDCLERYAALLAEVPQIFAPGVMFSYNNAGFCVLGRLVEAVRGEPFDRCLRRLLLDPLGLRHASLDAGEAILHRAAAGHVRPGDAEGTARLAVARPWAMARSNGPAGSMLAMRARDLVVFAELHLSKGRSRSGAPVLSAASVQEMRRQQMLLPDIQQGTAWGLGWELFARPGGLVVGHDGSTIGQSAMLRIVPSRGVAVAVVANGGDAKPLFAEIADRVLADLAGIAPAPAAAPDPAREHGTAPRSGGVDRYIGRYGSSTSETTVSRRPDGGLRMERRPLGELAELDEPVYRTDLLPWRGDSLLPLEPEGGVFQPVAFLGDDGAGRALYLHTGRADRRIGA